MRTTLLLPIAAAIAGASCATMTPAPPALTPQGVRFAMQRPEARSVALAGSFNQWSTSSHPLSRQHARGLWTAVVALPPGEHLFMYVVDGTEWVSPLADDYVDDGFGSKNGVVVVRPASAALRRGESKEQ
jgi:1,4-alpha-glucan branching enzyme